MASLALFVCFFGLLVMLLAYVRQFTLDFGENAFILGREERNTNSTLCIGIFILFTIEALTDKKNLSGDFNIFHYFELIALLWAFGQAWGCFSMRRRIELNYARQMAHEGQYLFDMYRRTKPAPTLTARHNAEQKLLEYRHQSPEMPDETYAFDPRRFDKAPIEAAKE